MCSGLTMDGLFKVNAASVPELLLIFQVVVLNGISISAVLMAVSTTISISLTLGRRIVVSAVIATLVAIMILKAADVLKWIGQKTMEAVSRLLPGMTQKMDPIWAVMEAVVVSLHSSMAVSGTTAMERTLISQWEATITMETDKLMR